MQNNQPAIGATALQDGSTCFRVWAPRAREVAVVLPHSDHPPLALQSETDGYFSGTFAGVADGARYYYLLDANYLHAFGPYFTNRYQTPWGDAVNYDGPDCDPVRQYFITNALYWIAEFQIDSLRLDAVHGIYDFSARHILQELAGAVHGFAAERGRRIYLIAESDLNDVRLIKPSDAGGLGLDAQWNDDFHHALRTVLTIHGHSGRPPAPLTPADRPVWCEAINLLAILLLFYVPAVQIALRGGP